MQGYGQRGVGIFLPSMRMKSDFHLCSVWQASETTSASRPIPPIHPQPLQSAIPAVDQIAYQFMYPPIQPTSRHLNTAGPGPWHTIGAPPPIAATASTSQQHVIQRLPPPAPGQSQPQDQFREGTWDGYHSPEDISTQQSSYDFPRYREDQNSWVPQDSYYGTAVSYFILHHTCSFLHSHSMTITMGKDIWKIRRINPLVQILLQDKLP